MLTIIRSYSILLFVECFNNTQQAAVAQAVERRIGSAEVTGPIPVGSFQVQVYACTFFIAKNMFCMTIYIFSEGFKYTAIRFVLPKLRKAI